MTEIEKIARAVEQEREACAALVAPASKAWWVRVQQDFDAMRAWKSGGEVGFPPHSDLGTCEDFIASAIRARSNESDRHVKNEKAKAAGWSVVQKQQAKIDSLEAQVKGLREALEDLLCSVNKTLDDNGYLADGDDCTLIDLKRGEAKARAALSLTQNSESTARSTASSPISQDQNHADPVSAEAPEIVNQSK